VHWLDTETAWPLMLARRNAAPVNCVVGDCRHPRATWFALYRVAENLWRQTDLYWCDPHVPEHLSRIP